MRIATTTGDFNAYVQHPMDTWDALRMLAESGFRHIDLNFYEAIYDGSPVMGDGWQAWAERVREAAAQLGLDFVQAHASNPWYDEGAERDMRMELIRREMHICRMLGIPCIVVHAICERGADRADFIEKNAAMYLDLLRTAEETGVAVLTENTCETNCPDYYLFTADDFHALDEAVGHHPLFGMCWDVGHGYVQGVDHYRELTALGERLKAVHIHDNLGRRSSPSFMDFHMQPYTGSCGYDAIVKALADMHFAGCFTLEANSIPEPAGFLGREALVLDGVRHDRLQMLPLSFKLRSERLMRDIAQFMLESYDCYEE